MQYIVVFITASNKKEAERISHALLDGRIIACSNIIDGINSHFWWKGKKEKARECFLIAKTVRTKLKKLIRTVTSLHSYDVPEIIAIPILAGSAPYLRWIKTETTVSGNRLSVISDQ